MCIIGSETLLAAGIWSRLALPWYGGGGCGGGGGGGGALLGTASQKPLPSTLNPWRCLTLLLLLPLAAGEWYCW